MVGLVTTRKLRSIRAYVVHGRTPTAVIDYSDFFDWLASLDGRSTRAKVATDLVLAIERAVRRDSFLHLRMVSGNPQDVPLLYNEATGETAEAVTPEGTWLASSSHVTVVPEERLLLIEGGRNGVTAFNLERYFRNIARTGGYARNLQIDISALPASSFEQEIEQLERIREATLVVSRPNSDWDEANDVLSLLADESGGQKAEVSVKAARGGSLIKTAGIIELIFQHLRRALPNLKGLRVVGRRADEKRDRTISLENHQILTTMEIDQALPQEDQDELVFEKATELAAVALPVMHQRLELPEVMPREPLAITRQGHQDSGDERE